jgi:hypothetical protein
MRKYLSLYKKVSIVLFGLNQIWSFLTDFRKNPHYQISWKSFFSGFRREVEYNYDLLSYYGTASSGNFLTTFRDKLSAP